MASGERRRGPRPGSLQEGRAPAPPSRPTCTARAGRRARRRRVESAAPGVDLIASMPRWTDPIQRRHPRAVRAVSAQRRFAATARSVRSATSVTMSIASSVMLAAPSPRNSGANAIVDEADGRQHQPAGETFECHRRESDRPVIDVPAQSGDAYDVAAERGREHVRHELPGEELVEQPAERGVIAERDQHRDHRSVCRANATSSVTADARSHQPVAAVQVGTSSTTLKSGSFHTRSPSRSRLPPIRSTRAHGNRRGEWAVGECWMPHSDVPLLT